MEEIIRNVSDLGRDERHAYEVVVGHKLSDDQQIVVRVVTPQSPTPTGTDSPTRTRLPEWCNVYAGLSDAEIAALEEDILRRADLTRI